ncbi:hypothetical protein [Tsukamurella sp. PLM1]|uniref:hypothetical protein n=1 Tax=Tsukamurella sp. PLM1 TaxID=2929795 RepID=UPI002057C025|nr:hypothetical protein [Tsukamurella sp. PLM1]BDH59491.1 hypothetical protein MTP03_44300 [Tsukamurella sp. PLM1]
MDHSAPTAAPFPQGLQTAERGYRITPSLTILDAGRTRVEFAILGPDGAPVTDFDEQHDKRLHFIAVQRDTSGFQHVHPVMDPVGTWSVELDLTPGVWRFFADVVPSALGSGIVLGADVAVPGEYRPVDLLAPRAVSQVDDYVVTLDGALVPGQGAELRATVTRGGVPVTDLEPYLAAYGHLVALRAGDLAFLHVHPEGDPSDPATPRAPTSGSTLWPRRRARTGCSSTSSTGARSAPPTSPSWPTVRRSPIRTPVTTPLTRTTTDQFVSSARSPTWDRSRTATSGCCSARRSSRCSARA